MMPTLSRLPRLYTIREAAEALRLCEKTVRRMIEAGVLPRHRMGRRVMVAEHDLGSYLASTKA